VKRISGGTSTQEDSVPHLTADLALGLKG
jgi:hypothetical protein